MKKLFTAKTGTVGYVGAHAVIGGSQFRLMDVDSSDIQHQLTINSIESLDFEFPDEANQVEFQKYLRAYKGNVRAAAEAYLEDLKSGKSENLASVAAPNASEVAEKAANAAAEKEATVKAAAAKAAEKEAAKKAAEKEATKAEKTK